MKNLISIILVFCSLLCSARTYYPPEFENAIHNGAETKFTILVKDSFGNPVSNASCRAVFNIGSLEGKKVHEKTSEKGLCTIEGLCGSYIYYSIEKDGYYPSDDDYRPQSLDPERLKDGRWLPWNPTVPIILKQEINPISMLHPVLFIQLPQNENTVGFDFLEQDWVEPYGKGKTQDIIVQLKIIDNNPRKRYLSILFPNPHDGGYRNKKDNYSTLKSAYHVETNRTFQSSFENSNTNIFTGLLFNQDEYVVFRIRCQVNEKGEIISALYGKIYGEMACDYFKKMNIHYFLNLEPNNTNLEYNGESYANPNFGEL